MSDEKSDTIANLETKLSYDARENSFDSKSKLEESLDSIFSGITGEHFVLNISTTSSSEHTDGIEAIAMLVVLEQFVVDHCGISIDCFISQRSPTYDYATLLLFEIQHLLKQRIAKYSNEQMVWIRSQRCDPKKPGIDLPVCKLPGLILQVLDIIGEEVNQSKS
jgi:hypothetical protein